MRFLLISTLMILAALSGCAGYPGGFTSPSGIAYNNEEAAYVTPEFAERMEGKAYEVVFETHPDWHRQAQVDAIGGAQVWYRATYWKCSSWTGFCAGQDTPHFVQVMAMEKCHARDSLSHELIHLIIEGMSEHRDPDNGHLDPAWRRLAQIESNLCD
jgi:anaerobic selenocysteine-containing dehydrogenase